MSAGESAGDRYQSLMDVAGTRGASCVSELCQANTAMGRITVRTTRSRALD